jgi:hypothetical protein
MSVSVLSGNFGIKLVLSQNFASQKTASGPFEERIILGHDTKREVQ